ncbi:MAG: hypothetical protein P8012_00150 [Desulfobacterales bacterium]
MDSNFLSTVQPYRIDPKRWWVDIPVKDASELKPDTGNDVLLIVGDGRDVLADLINFWGIQEPADIMCMNFSPKIIPEGVPIQHYIAGDSHTPSMQKIAGQLPSGVLRHCWNQNSTNFDIRWGRNTSKGWTGTTANLGVKIGIALGYMKIVLAGCPMDTSGNWYRDSLPENDVKRGKDHTAHLWKWTEIASRPIGRFIRSMSGNTAMLFGEPDKEWLQNV